MKGVYVLIIKLSDATNITVGKLGKLYFRKGFYTYVGSALGKAGFKRVTRHFKTSEGINNKRKWHIDYLLPYSKIICAVLLPTHENLECIIASSIKEFSDEIYGFGCSDCSCSSHLFFTDTDFRNKIINTCISLVNESIIIHMHV